MCFFFGASRALLCCAVRFDCFYSILCLYFDWGVFIVESLIRFKCEGVKALFLVCAMRMKSLREIILVHYAGLTILI